MTGLLLPAAVIAVASGPVLAAWWLRRNLTAVTVRGTSMQPSLQPGDRVLIRRAGLRRVRAGQLVVTLPGRPVRPVTAGHPALVIKRVVAVPGDPVPRATVPALADVPESRVPPGRFVALGDNPVSTDSRQWGYFHDRCLLGIVIRRLPG